jgi:hypothetical protein
VESLVEAEEAARGRHPQLEAGPVAGQSTSGIMVPPLEFFAFQRGA